jgi:TolB-like protein
LIEDRSGSDRAGDIAAAVLVFYGSAIKSARPQSIRSVAVLPLKNLSVDAKQEYLADAMTEEVIARLAEIRDLRVLLRYIEPGRPMQNGHIESFNGRLRDECLTRTGS